MKLTIKLPSGLRICFDGGTVELRAAGELFATIAAYERQHCAFDEELRDLGPLQVRSIVDAPDPSPPRAPAPPPAIRPAQRTATTGRTTPTRDTVLSALRLLGPSSVAADSFDAIPDAQLLADVAAEPGEVGDHDPGVLALLDAFDGLEQAGALLERQAAADVEFGGQHVELDSAVCGFALERGLLLAVGVERVASAAAEVADADDSCPRPVVRVHARTLSSRWDSKVLWGSVTESTWRGARV